MPRDIICQLGEWLLCQKIKEAWELGVKKLKLQNEALLLKHLGKTRPRYFGFNSFGLLITRIKSL